MTNNILLLFFAVLILNGSILGQTFSDADSIVYKTKKYQIAYPEYLNIDDSKRDGTEFIIYTSKDSDYDDFIENINLVSQDLINMNLDLDGFIEITKNELKDVGEIVESKKLANKGYDYHKMIYTLTQNGVQLTFLQHSQIINNNLYVLTFSGKADAFKDYYPEMRRVMLSFTPL